MTTQTASIAAPKQHTTRFITAAAGTVLALTAAVGLGAWQANHKGGTKVAEPQAAPMLAPVAVRSTSSRAIDTALRYYLVGSQAQATAVHAALEEANAVQATSGEPTRAHHVEQLDSVDAEAQLLQAMSIDDAIRGTLDLPPVRIIDLRQVGVAAPAPTTRGDMNDGVTTRGGLAELYAEQDAERVAADAARWSTLGGRDAPYRASAAAPCGTTVGPAHC